LLVLRNLLLLASLLLLVVPREWAIRLVPYVAAAAFVSGWLATPKFGDMSLALLIVVISQAASALWSIHMDERASAREEQAAAHRQHDDEVRQRQRDRIEAASRQQDAARRDSLNLRLLTEALRVNVEAVSMNVGIIKAERDTFIAKSAFSLSPLMRLESDWWRTLLLSPPSLALSRPTLLDSLRALHALTLLTAEQLDARAAHIRTSDQMRGRVEGQEDPFMRKLRKLDDLCLAYSDAFLTASRAALGRLEPQPAMR
jgi:hypothetical protein